MTVAIRIGNTVATHWQRYEIEIDLRTAADSFSLAFAPAREDVWDLCRPDSAAQILIGDTPVLTGLIDGRTRRGDRGGSAIHVHGRCKVARLVDESMDLMSLNGLTLLDLMGEVAGDWFDEVTFSNSRNRDLIRGKNASKARSGPEPIFANRSEAPRKVEPGETRWELAQRYLEPAGLLAWGSGDGKDLIVGKPSYKQDAQFRFVCGERGNVLRWEYEESVADRYSEVTCVGTAPSDWQSYGSGVTRHRAKVTSSDFKHRKCLLVADDDIRSRKDAERRAQREMAIRDASGTELTLTVLGHTQLREPGGVPSLFAPDTVAEFEDELLGLRGRYLITSVRFDGSKSGTTTTLGLVPEGTELVT